MAALLGHRAQRVFSLESNPELVALAKESLRRSGVRNVVVQEQDGLAGLPGEAPFDAILLSGSVAEVPAQLLNQLKVGGRLLAIVGDAPVMRATLVTRQADKQFNSVVLFDTAAPRLHGFAEHSTFSF